MRKKGLGFIAIMTAAMLMAGCGSSAGTTATTESKAEAESTAVESQAAESEAAESEAVESEAAESEAAEETAAVDGVTPDRHIIITTGGGGEPYSLIAEDGTWTGIDAEMWAEITKRAGWTYEVLQATGAGATFGQLDAGRADIVSNCYAVNADRVAKYTVSDPYYGDAQCVIVAPDSDIMTFADLAGKKVGVLNGQAAQQAIEKLSEEIGFELILYEGENGAVGYQDVGLGRLDAFATTDSAVYKQMNATGAEYRFLEERLYANDVAFYFAKTDEGRALRDEVNIILAGMMEDGTTAEIVTKFMYSDMTQLIIPYDELGLELD